MTTTIARLYRAAASLGKSKAVPAPSGGWYFVENPASAVTTFGLVTSAGAISWQTEITFAGSPAGEPYLISSATHVALIYCYIDTGDYKTVVHLYDSSGAQVWETLLPLRVMNADVMEMASDNSVYIGGRTTTSTESLLTKLDSATGAISWTVNTRDTSSDATYGGGPIGILSGGDPVIVVHPSTAHTFGFYGYLQRLNASTGAVTWSMGLIWSDTPFVARVVGLAVSATDEIYTWSHPYVNDNVDQVDILKFNSSGTETWTATVACPSPDALEDHVFLLNGQGKGVATAAGLHMPMYFGVSADDSIARVGHLFAPAAGTIGAGLAKLISYTADAVATEPPRMSGPAGELAFAYQYAPTTYQEAWLVRSTDSALEDATVGDVTRETFLYDMVALGGSSTTASYTRQSAPSFSALTALVETPTTGSVSITSYGSGATFASATGIASTLAFGLPVKVGDATGTASALAFGTTSHAMLQQATGLASGLLHGSHSVLLKYPATGSEFPTSFGLPTVNLNLAYAATALEPTTAFGETWAWPGLAPPPRFVTSVDPTLAFGLPVSLPTISAVAEGFQTTAFGEARSGYGLAATGLASTLAFGTGSLSTVRSATGFSTTLFGLAQVGAYGYPQGFAANLRFGLPEALYANRCEASGWSSTAFGTPSIIAALQRARGARFRTAFGQAQAERTAP